jgi:hypothetical protein
MPTPIACSVALIALATPVRSPRLKVAAAAFLARYNGRTFQTSRLQPFYCLTHIDDRIPSNPAQYARRPYGPFASLGSSERDLNHAIEGARTFIREIKSGVSDRPTRRTGHPSQRPRHAQGGRSATTVSRIRDASSSVRVSVICGDLGGAVDAGTRAWGLCSLSAVVSRCWEPNLRWE